MRAALAGLLAAVSLGGPALASPAAAPPDIRARGDSAEVLWQIRVPGAPNGWVNAITPLADGSFLASGFVGRDDAATGEDWQAFTLRFDDAGRTLWTQHYGAGSGTDAFWDAEPAADGGFVAVGFTDRIGAGGLDGWIVRLRADGSLVGESTVGGPSYDRLTDIAPVAAGGFVAAGFTTVEGLGREFLVVRIDDAGKEVWRRTYGGPGDQTALYIQAAADGGFVVAGGGPGGASAADEGDMLVLKLSANGEEVWRRVVGDAAGSEIPHNLHILADGRIRMSGYTDVQGAQGPHDALVATLSADGDLLHAEFLGGAGDDRAMVSGIDAEGREWVTGYATGGPDQPWDMFLTRVDRDGRFEGPVVLLDSGGDDRGTAALPLPDGTLLLGGYSALVGGAGEDPVILRLGPPRWETAEAWRRGDFPGLKPTGPA
jgi:hypothetical protein